MTAGSTRLRRLVGGAGGQAFAKSSIIAYQLITVPLLIGAWGLSTYGSWLALTALAAVMSNANLGIATAAAVEITGTPADAPIERLSALVRTAQAMLAALLGVAALALGAAAWWLPLGPWLNLEGVAAADVRWVVLLVVGQVVIDNFRAIAAALILRTGRYGIPNLLGGSFKLIEIAALAVVVASGGGIAAAAAIGTGCALANLIAHRLCVMRWHGPISGGGFSLALARGLLGPSFGNFALSVGVNLITVYGTRIALTAALGPRALAAFAVMATAVRMIDQLNAILISALQHEFARAAREDGGAERRMLLTRGGQISFAGYLLLAAGLLILGPTAFTAWTHGEVRFDYPIVAVLLVGVLFQQVGKTSVHFLVGANRVLGFAIGAVAGYGIGLGIAILLMPHMAAMGAAIGIAAGEWLVLLLSLRLAARYVDVAPAALLRRQLDLRELIGAIVPLVRRVRAS